jgi:two-component system, cell cycle sensor histidine kinase and response regulator CckA
MPTSPMSALHTPAPQALQDTPGPRPAPLVLVVDDDASQRLMARYVLERDGYAVEEAADGRQALDMCAERLPDIVLLDAVMPVMDGFHACEQIRLRPGGDATAVLIITGLNDAQAVDQAFASGATDFVTKPIHWGVLRRRVFRLVESARTQARLNATEARMHALVRHTPDGILTCDADGDICSSNPAAERLFACRAADMVGLPVQAFISTASLEHLLQSGASRELTGRRKDGATFPAEVSVSGFSDGGDRFFSVILRDVSERKRAEESLIEAEARYRGIFENAVEGIFQTTPDGRMLSANPMLARILGFRSPEELLAEVLVHDNHFYAQPGRRAEFVRRLREQESVTHFESQVRRADGALRWISENARAIQDADGNLIRYEGTVEDVTERKRTETVLRESEERFRALADCSPMLVWVTDMEGRCTFFNQAWLQLTGRTAEQEKGDGWIENIHPDDLTGAVAAYRRAFAERQPFTLEYRLRRHDGTYRWLMDCGNPHFLPDGTFTGYIGSAADITDRKAAEENLRLRDRAIEAASQGIVLTDPSRPDNPILHVNSAFEKLTGYTAAEAVGRNCRFLQGPETDPAAVLELRDAVKEQRSCAVELLNYRKDGVPFWLALSISPIRDASGKVTHFVGVQTDITERKRLEQQFQQAQKMEAVGRLAGGIAHDFNNLLTAILGYGQILLSEVAPDDPLRSGLEEIKRAGERAATLTHQLLAFSRRQVLLPKVLDLNTIVADVQKMLHRMIGEDVALITNPGKDLGRVKADPGQLIQVLMNLAVNSRDAMPDGGALTIETANVDLSEADVRQHPGLRPGKYVLLAVSDTGCGMDKATQARIFEPFFTTKEVGKGTGLGLATVYGIVKQSDGYIAVHSEPDRGTTFKIYFPRIEEAAPASTARQVKAIASTGSETVLVVEDEAGVRNLVSHVLRRHGYTVLEASHGEEALSLVDQYAGAIDLLVTDMIMPVMSGRQLADLLTAKQEGLKVVYMSGYVHPEGDQPPRGNGRRAFLQKPFKPDVLARMVREVLDR